MHSNTNTQGYMLKACSTFLQENECSYLIDDNLLPFATSAYSAAQYTYNDYIVPFAKDAYNTAEPLGLFISDSLQVIALGFVGFNLLKSSGEYIPHHKLLNAISLISVIGTINNLSPGLNKFRETSPESTKAVIDYGVKRIPNYQESTALVLGKSAVEVFLPERFKQTHNPTSTTFIRDSFKVIPMIYLYSQGAQVGKSGYYYDEFLLAASVVKPLCKISIILPLSKTLGTDIAGRSANYICETPSRLLTKVHREYQDTYSKEDRASHSISDQYEFFVERFTVNSVFESSIAAVLKTITTDQLGEWIGKLTKIEGDNNQDSHIISKWVSEYILGFEDLSDNHKTFIKQVAKNFFNTFALTPPARIIEDLPGIVRKTDSFKSIYNFTSTKSEEAFECFSETISEISLSYYQKETLGEYTHHGVEL